MLKAKKEATKIMGPLKSNSAYTGIDEATRTRAVDSIENSVGIDFDIFFTVANSSGTANIILKS